MSDAPHRITGESFIRYAGSNLDRWLLIVGLSIEHPHLGTGEIVDVSQKQEDITLLIHFADGQAGARPRAFAPQVLNICERIELPTSLADRILRAGAPPAQPVSPPRPVDQLPRSSIHYRPTPSGSPQFTSGPAFEQGDEVVLRTSPRKRGMISGQPYFSAGEWQYRVFFSADETSIYRESDLNPYQVTMKWGSLSEFLRNLALVKLQRPLTEHLYALYGSRTKFEVYQFKPAVKFLSNPYQRLLIADEVGLGKTIEAGIIYLELQARLNLNRVLVVCPSGLRHKWQDELKQRFDEEFTILDTPSLRRFLTMYRNSGEHSTLRGIVSLELLRRTEIAEQFQEMNVNLDLVIMDEAHHCRNTGTLSNQIANILSDNADALLLLTATPLQIGNQDLFNLMHILEPGEFDNAEVFLERIEPNRYINRAAQILETGDNRKALQELRKVESTRQRRRFTGNPYYHDLCDLLGKFILKREEQIRAHRKLTELNTLAQVFTRTRKREIAEKVPVRAAYTLSVQFSPVEKRFYHRVIQHVRDEFAALYGSNFTTGWVSVMRERQVASCISAARERFAELAADDVEPYEEEDVYDPAFIGELDDDHRNGRSKRFRRLHLPEPGELARDTKFEVFWETLSMVLAEDDTSKVIVFSFFRATIDYLYKQLQRRGVRVLYLHGGLKVHDRQAIIDDFRSKPEIRVLISSEVGSEGLDFQFCNSIFNYDLPWNPMKLEQRIGRIDRFGQESERIRIYNLVIEDSIESRMLMRLYDRIGLFQQSIGDIEAILGEEIRDLTRQVYSNRLSPEEEIKLAEQAADNIIRRRQELEEFEKNKLQFLGQEAIFSTIVSQTIEAGNYVSESEIRGLVETFVQECFPRSLFVSNMPADRTYSISINEDLASTMRNYVYKHKKADLTAQEFLKALTPGKILPEKGASSHIFQ
jgi:superfamily II DNA or RNA helicase